MYPASTIKSLLAGALVCAALLFSQQSFALTINFTTDEGYSATETTLNGEPSSSPKWHAHDSWLVNGTAGMLDTNRGYSSNNLAAIYESTRAISQGQTVSVSVDFQFAGLGGNSSTSRYVFSAALGTGSNPATAFTSNFGKVIVARLGNASNYVMYFATDVNGYTGAKSFTPASIGDNGVLDDLTDNLRLTLSMTKGASASNWAVDLSLTNLNTETVVATSSLTDVSTSEAFYTDDLYAMMATLSSNNNGGPSSLTVDQFSTSIPEPESSAMLFTGPLLLLVCLAYRRKKC